MVGLLTLLGITYMMLSQVELRHKEGRAHEAEADEARAMAITQLSHTLIEAVEKLADRDGMIMELRSRIEQLEERDQQKTTRILELERKVQVCEEARQQAIAERDALRARISQGY